MLHNFAAFAFATPGKPRDLTRLFGLSLYRCMSLGPVAKDKPNMPRTTTIKGTLLDADVDRAWPLWFVAFMGWHAVTFAYLMVIGSSAEWLGRFLLSRFGFL